MAYANYEDYVNLYFGNAIPESDFNRFAMKAGDKIDHLTNDRLSDTSWLSEKDFIKIKKACCAMAEGIYYKEQLATIGFDSVGTDNGKGKIISSVSSGSESVSYVTGISASSIEGIALKESITKAEIETKSYLAMVKYKDKGYNLLFVGAGYE